MERTSKILLSALLVILCACAADLGDKKTPLISQRAAVGGTLSVVPPIANVPAGQNLQLMANGGYPPYRYFVTSGLCNVDYSLGLVRASSTNGDCTVTVYDSAGSIGTSTLSVTGGSDPTTAKPPVWVAGTWGACASGTQARTVTCVDSLGRTVDPSVCPVASKPATTQACGTGGGVTPVAKGCQLEATVNLAGSFGLLRGFGATSVSQCKTFCDTVANVVYCQFNVSTNGGGMCGAYDQVPQMTQLNGDLLEQTVMLFGGGCQ